MARTMRRCCVAVAFVALAGINARADIVAEYTISGNIIGATGAYSSLNGDSFIGTFSYDLSTRANASGRGFAEYATGALDFTVGSHEFSFSSNKAMTSTVLDDDHGVSGLFAKEDASHVHASVDFFGWVDSTSLPEPIPVSGLSFDELSYRSHHGGFLGEITEITAVHYMPEPPTVLAALVGSLAAAGYAWKHRRGQAPSRLAG
jgi:hypothetical protein